MILILTQFLRPHGDKRDLQVEIDDALRDKVRQIERRGLRFTAEVLPAGEVSFCIEDEQSDLAIELAPNGPGSEWRQREILEDMITRFEIPPRMTSEDLS